MSKLETMKWIHHAFCAWFCGKLGEGVSIDLMCWRRCWWGEASKLEWVSFNWIKTPLLETWDLFRLGRMSSERIATRSLSSLAAPVWLHCAHLIASDFINLPVPASLTSGARQHEFCHWEFLYCGLPSHLLSGFCKVIGREESLLYKMNLFCVQNQVFVVNLTPVILTSLS